MGDYQVLFSGEVSRGADAESVRVRLARELGIDERKSRQLFSGRTVVVRSQLNQREAVQLQERLETLGAMCRVKNLGVPSANGPTIDKDASRLEGKVDHTLKDITAAHIECPRCGHLQLESTHCAKCGVDIREATAQKRREDLLIEKQIRELRSGPSRKSIAAAHEPDGPVAGDQQRTGPVRGDSRRLDAKRSGFIRNLFKKQP